MGWRQGANHERSGGQSVHQAQVPQGLAVHLTAGSDRKSAIRFIVCLGIVSLFADMTYEGSRSILGPFLKDLGASATQVGLIAGFGEMCGASLRLFSGRFADRTRAYWTITIIGYSMNVIVVPALAFAGNWKIAALLVIAERTGKSLRAPARDVLLSEATSVVGHGWGFGLHAAFDQAGAVLGPLLMAAAVAQSKQFGPAFLRLAYPGAACLIALVLARWMNPGHGAAAPAQARTTIPRIFWPYIVAAGLLACGFVDFPLLAYHFQKTRLAREAAIPLLYALAMAINGITALLFGKLFDRYGILALTWGILISAMSLPLGFLGNTAAAVICVVCWGTGVGAQDACLRAGIAQVISMDKRGTAFGTFNAVFGVFWFAGSAAMGFLLDHSIAALVAFGMTFQLSAAAAFYWIRKPLAAGRI